MESSFDLETLLSSPESFAMMGAGFLVLGLIVLLVAVFLGATFALLFHKAGWKWYEALISGHNGVVLLQMAGKPIWWLFLPILGYLGLRILNLIFIFLGALMNSSVIGEVLGLISSLTFIAWMIYLHIQVLKGLARNFGKGTGFMVGLFFLPFVFFPILAFGRSQYQRLP